MPITLLLAAAIAGCGGGSEGSTAEGKPQLETTDAGTRTIAATDEKAGLRIEVQDDSLYVTVADGAPQSTAALEGEPLGASCEDDGKEGVEASPEFPVYWRDQSEDWGTALARADEQGRVLRQLRRVRRGRGSASGAGRARHPLRAVRDPAHRRARAGGLRRGDRHAAGHRHVPLGRARLAARQSG